MIQDQIIQEGQHPLTGQRAADFRLSFLVVDYLKPPCEGHCSRSANLA